MIDTARLFRWELAIEVISLVLKFGLIAAILGAALWITYGCRKRRRRRLKGMLLFVLIAATPLFSQVALEASPEPMAVTGDIPLKVVGLWDLRLCNDGPTARVDIYEERIFMAKWATKETGQPSGIAFLTAGHAARVLQVKQGKNKKQIAAEWIGTGLDLVLPLIGWDVISASKRTMGAIAAGRGVAAVFQSRLQSQVPSITLFTDELLKGQVALAPGMCTTRTVFAAKMRKPQTVVARIP